jgi:hypothetical protein
MAAYAKVCNATSNAWNSSRQSPQRSRWSWTKGIASAAFLPASTNSTKPSSCSKHSSHPSSSGRAVIMSRTSPLIIRGCKGFGLLRWIRIIASAIFFNMFNPCSKESSMPGQEPHHLRRSESLNSYPAFGSKADNTSWADNPSSSILCCKRRRASCNNL